MLRSGSATTTRRPSLLCTIWAWSKAGSKPNSDSRNPPRPSDAPWHAPALQPAFVRIGTISRVKLTGMSAAAFVTVTGTVAFTPLASMVSVVLPSATGRTIPFSTIATFAFALAIVAVRVRSNFRPSAQTPSTMTPLVRARPGQFHLGGINDELPRHFGVCRERGTAHRQNGRDSQRASEHGGSSGASRREKRMRKRAQAG